MLANNKVVIEVTIYTRINLNLSHRDTKLRQIPSVCGLIQVSVCIVAQIISYLCYKAYCCYYTAR